MRHLILIVLAFSALSMTAQQNRAQHRKGAGMDKMQFMKDLTPEQAANLQTKRMALDLNLTDAQQKKIYDLNLEAAKERRSKMAARKENNEKENREKPSGDEQYELIDRRLDKQIAHKSEMQGILGKEQFQKWERQHKSVRKQHKRNGRKHRSRRSK